MTTKQIATSTDPAHTLQCDRVAGSVVETPEQLAASARAGNHHFCLLSALRTHAKAQYKSNLLWETLRALNRPGRARTEGGSWEDPGRSSH
jgi:hypothetical protein